MIVCCLCTNTQDRLLDLARITTRILRWLRLAGWRHVNRPPHSASAAISSSLSYCNCVSRHWEVKHFPHRDSDLRYTYALSSPLPRVARFHRAHQPALLIDLESDHPQDGQRKILHQRRNNQACDPPRVLPKTMGDQVEETSMCNAAPNLFSNTMLICFSFSSARWACIHSCSAVSRTLNPLHKRSSRYETGPEPICWSLG